MKKNISNIILKDDAILIERLKNDLLASKESFKQLLNSSHVPQWIYDIESMQLLFVNAAAVKSYGYSIDELLKMTVLEIAPSEEIKQLILYNEFMKTTNEPFSVVTPHRRKNNYRVLVETTYVNINYMERPCVLVTSVDITERIKLEERLSLLKLTRQQKIIQATINGQERERDQIGRDLHDNINQLLTAAKLHLEFARSNEELRVDFIDRGEKILTKVISEIKALSNSLVPPTLKDIGFKNSLKELFETYLVTRTFNIQLFFEEELELLNHEIQISLFRIIQEQLNNILNHAEARNIIISLSITDQIHLFIKDDGGGFDTKIRRQGAGIANIQSRTGLYNGTIKVISQPGKGCTLAVLIPHKRKNKQQSCGNVLIVEDDIDDQHIITKAFTEVAPHCHITCLNDGKMLVEHLQSITDNQLPSLIVLDYNMPLLNGLEALKVLELDPRVNKIPKIIYSSSALNYIRSMSHSGSAKAYITKGTTFDEIKENVQEMLSFM